MNIFNSKRPLAKKQLNFSVVLSALVLLFVFSFSNAEAKNDFKVVAYHVDLRVQVMPMPTLKALATEVADLGFNTILMEWEATYPYKQHSIISNKYAYTRAEVEDFIKHSEGLGLDVIPLQQNFGHSEYILMHERYAYLRSFIRKYRKDYGQIDPTRHRNGRGSRPDCLLIR